MIKRIFSLILCFSMIVCAVSFAEESLNYEKEIDFLSSIGVLDKVGFTPEAEVTRGGFALMLSELLYKDIDTMNTLGSSFGDITPSDECFGAVTLLEGLKIVRGNSQGKFNPASPITTTDAVVMVIRALGYDIYAQESGGYPIGYINVAKKISLTDNISLADVNLNAKTAAKLLYNALFVSSVEFSYVGDNGIQLEIDYLSNFLSKHMGIKLHKAQLIHDGMRSFDNSGLLENQMILKDLKTGEEILVNCSDSSYTELFGCFVDAYIRYDESGTRELVNCRAAKDVEITTLYSEDMINPSLSSVEYEFDESGKTKNIKFDTSALYIFVNGVKATRYTDTMVKPQFGFTEFIDNNGDGKTDVILVNDIKRNIVVNSVSSENESIICKANGTNSLILSGNDVFYRIYKNGKLIDLEGIANDNIVSVAASKDKIEGGVTLYTLYVSDTTKTDVITGYAEGECVFSDDAEYELSKLYLNSVPSLFKLISTGNSYTLRYDAFGKIAWIDGMRTTDVNFCYLLNVKQKSPYDPVKLYFYSEYAVFNELSFAKAVTIDGKIYKSGSGNFKNELITALNTRYNRELNITEVVSNNNAELYNHSKTEIVPRPAILKINGNGEVYYIDTDTPTYQDKELEENDPYTLVAGNRMLRESRLNIKTNGNPSITDGSFLVTSNTLVMQVADIDRYGINESTYSHDYINLYELPLDDETSYKIMTNDDLSDYDRYDFQPYNIDPETGVAGLIVIRGYHLFHGAGNNKENFLENTVFTKISKIYDETGENRELYKLYYHDGAVEHSVKFDKNNLPLYFHNIIFGGKILDYDQREPLQPGDIITVHEENGWLKAIRRYIDISNINEKTVYTNGVSAPTYAYRAPNAAQKLNSPYDNVMSLSTTAMASNYLYDLSLPLNATGLTIKSYQPYNAEGKKTNLKEYLNNNGGFTRYISIGEEGLASQILTVEEIHHDPDGNCKYTVKDGSFADLKFLSSEGYYNASRLYTIYIVAEPKRFVIFNLKPEHNGK